ncbi:hypothetical protein G9A89_016855 [Geosiphon pyriformis]|nr:hypothetical protein G9A89_016855 [Geosiphon pyriformis]
MNNLVSIFMETKLKNKAHSWLVDKFDGVCMFSSGLDSGYMNADVMIIMNRSLARHVYKVSEVSGCLLCIRLLFKNKLLVSILGLYAGASLTTQFSQADEINSLIARAVNESFFVILGGDFNEDGFHKCASFKNNSRSVAKTIDYVFVSSNLVNTIIQCNVFVVSDHFDMNYRAVSVSLSLGGLLDNNFKSFTLVNITMFSDKFAASIRFSDLDAIWCVVCKWFREFDEVFTKNFSKFHKLELLVFRIVKALCGEDAGYFSSVVQNLVDSGADSDHICSALFGARKSYHASKFTESLRTKKVNIKSAIDKRMESFKVNKSHIIRSVLEHSFHKVVLDYLMVNNDLILEPNLVKSKVNVIMEGWTRKHYVANDILIDWHCQYQPLKYVFDEAFSGVMCLIGFDKFFGVVSELPDGKAAGLSGISNKLWKHCDKSVLDMLLVILNLCLSGELGVLINTCPIALIKMACKILSKILFNRISSACSAFDVFHGNNFSVLNGMTTQSPIFTIGSVIEDALEKDRELWLMCSKFIHFFGNIHNNRTNWVMTDFGLMNSYHVHNGLDQGEESVYRYRLNSHFISKNCRAESWVGHSFFFATGAFVDDTIWVGSSLSATQHILNVATGMIHILFDCKLSLGGSLASSFWFHSRVLMSVVLDKSLFCKFLCSLWHYGVAFVNQLRDHNGGVFSWHIFKRWKRLDPHGPVPKWFDLSVAFLEAPYYSLLVLANAGPLDICGSTNFVSICNRLSQIGTNSLSVYTNSSLKNLGMVGCKTEAAAFFENINLGLGVGVYGLLSSTLTELQAIVLALECVPAAHSVHLFLDSQTALDACSKNLKVKWHKIKGHSGIPENNCTNNIANAVSFSGWYLPSCVSEHFLLVDGGVVFGNSRHFVYDVFHAVCHVHWESLTL